MLDSALQTPPARCAWAARAYLNDCASRTTVASFCSFASRSGSEDCTGRWERSVELVKSFVWGTLAAGMVGHKGVFP